MEIERNAPHPFLMKGDLVTWTVEEGAWKVYDNYVDVDGDIKIAQRQVDDVEYRYANVNDITPVKLEPSLGEKVWGVLASHLDLDSALRSSLVEDLAQLGVGPKKRKWRAVAELESVEPPARLVTIFGEPIEWVEVTDD